MADCQYTLAHPWHGIPIGEDVPNIVNVFVEMVPTDTVKYEVDKLTGHLKVDRPQKYTNLCPAPYGFIPRTLCGDKVASFSMEKTGKHGVKGDGDPMDICVLTERSINHGAIILRARPIGGLRLFDGGDADDKIIGVLLNDPAYGHFEDISDIPPGIIDRLRHYFLTYKQIPGVLAIKKQPCIIAAIYGRDEAIHVIRESMADYQGFVEANSQL